MHSNRAVGDLAKSGGSPNYGIMQNYIGAGFNWVPFYSKMSFLGKKILYFDMAITPTIGMTGYDQQLITGSQSQNAFTYEFDITQYYFFTSISPYGSTSRTNGGTRRSLSMKQTPYRATALATP